MGTDARRGNGGLTIIAEAGVNHAGRIEAALSLVDDAKKAGADYVKLQAFQPDQHEGAYRALLEPLALSERAIECIAGYCACVGIGFICTPFDLPSLELVARLKPDAMKVSSRHVRDHAFLRAVRARWDGPIWQSFGASTFEDVAGAAAITKPEVAFHCVSAYPAPVKACSLYRVPMVATWANDAEYGWSDHTANALVPALAVALGARYIEAHICNAQSGGPDLKASLMPFTFRVMVENCRTAALAVPDGPQCDAERHNRDSFPVTA